MEKDCEKRRCRKIKIKTGNSAKEKQKFTTIDKVSRSTKYIYNTGLFCRRQWYSLYKKQIEYYIENIDTYIEQFSPSDRLKLASYSKDNNDFVKKIINYSHKSEVTLKHFDTETTEQILEDYEETIDMDFTEISDKISSIPLDEKESILIEYQKEIIAPLRHKESVKGKRKKTDEQEEKMKERVEKETEKLNKMKKRFGNIINKKSIIINSVPNRDVIDAYVRSKCDSYRDVSSQSAQQTLKKLDKSYKSFFESIKNPSLNARLPKYLKSNHFNVVFQKQSFVQLKGSIRLALGKTSKKDKDSLDYLYIKTGKLNKTVTEVEIVPSNKATHFHLILKYDMNLEDLGNKKSSSISHYASIDLGITNLATVYIPYKRPYIIDGSEIKGINYETKRKNAKNQKNKVGEKRTEHTWLDRDQKVRNYLHIASTRLITLLKLCKIKHLIIGYNKSWKLNCNMGKANNEMFYKIPYRHFVNMLFYKGEENGITVEETNESYTSKCDSLENETVGYHKSYKGKRCKRGLFQSNSGICINSDVNGAINILRKYVYRKLEHLVNDLHNCIQNTKSKIHNCVKSGIVKRFFSRRTISFIDLVVWS